MSIIQSRRQFLATAALDGLFTLVPGYAQDGVAETNRPLNAAPVNGSVTVAFDADDPDRWPLAAALPQPSAQGDRDDDRGRL